MGLFLLVIGIILIIFNLKAIKREKSSFKNVFHNTEEELMEFEVRLGEVRREFSETILELQKEILELKKESLSDNEINKAKEDKKIHEEIIEETVGAAFQNEEIKEERIKLAGNNHINIENNTKNNSVKIEEISKLLHDGLTIEEISIKLGVGKGEVLLIKELYLR
jgi:hypothetical protein